jgi:hypothetical protein
MFADREGDGAAGARGANPDAGGIDEMGAARTAGVGFPLSIQELHQSSGSVEGQTDHRDLCGRAAQNLCGRAAQSPGWFRAPWHP